MADFEEYDVDVSTDELPADGKPAPIDVEIAGKTYTLSWSKDHFWMQYYTAFTSGQGGAIFQATIQLLSMSLGQAQALEIETRLRNPNDDIDTADLMAAVLEMAGQWEDYAVIRMEEMGASIPEKIKARLNREQRRAGSKKRVVKAPSGGKR